MKVFVKNKCSYYGESVDKLMICLKLSMRIFCEDKSRLSSKSKKYIGAHEQLVTPGVV